MRLSIFTTVFIVFLLAIIPLYGLGVLINNAGRNFAKSEMYASKLNNIDFYVSNIEQEIKTIVNTEVRLINNANIHELAEFTEIPNDYAFYQLLDRVRRELTQLKNAHRYIENAYILFPLSGIKLTATSYQFMTDLDHASVMDTAFYEGFPFINHAASNGTYINFSSQYYVAHPEPEKVKYVIVTKINTVKITDEMNAYFTGFQDQTCFLGEDSGLRIVNGTDAIAGVITEIASLDSMRERIGVIENIYLKTTGKKIMLAYRRSDYLKTTFILFGEEQHLLDSLQIYRYWIWVFTFFMLLLLVVFTLWTRRILAIPMNRLISAIRQGIAGDLNNDIEYRTNEEFMYIYRQFNEMLRLQREAINQAHERALLLKDAEFKVLQYQINPHFLYNCFFMMYQMLEAGEYEALRPMLRHMGSYFNFITKSDSQVTLAQELSFCADYIGMQSIRFENRITVEMEAAPPGWENMVIPRIILQPLLENCYKHGLADKERDGRIRLSFDLAEHAVIVEDNGDGLTAETLEQLKRSLDEDNPGALSGLCNVHQRLLSSFGAGSGLRLCRSEWGGLSVGAIIRV